MRREPIYRALYKLLNEGVTSAVTFSRVLAHWDDVSPNQQPAMFMTQDSQIVERESGRPARYTLGVKLWIYCHRDSMDDIPVVQLNNVLDEIEAAIQPDPSPSYRQTLGGLVEKCWIDGSIDTDEGTLGNQAVAIVPIRILVVAS